MVLCVVLFFSRSEKLISEKFSEIHFQKHIFFQFFNDFRKHFRKWFFVTYFWKTFFKIYFQKVFCKNMLQKIISGNTWKMFSIIINKIEKKKFVVGWI